MEKNGKWKIKREEGERNIYVFIFILLLVFLFIFHFPPFNIFSCFVGPTFPIPTPAQKLLDTCLPAGPNLGPKLGCLPDIGLGLLLAKVHLDA